jgi:predicted transcriptional regulator
MALNTTVCLDPKTKESLKELKNFPSESFNSVIQRLINEAYDNMPLSDETIRKIEEGLKEYKEGNYYSIEEVAEELGIRIN